MPKGASATIGTIPVILLTGFLGAGKTTLLTRLIRDPRFSDPAVIINEFGEVALDHLLVEDVPEEMTVEVTSGCLCCTVRGDIRRALLMLHHRAEQGELPLFSRLVIETTGLADPAPVIQTLMGDPGLTRIYQLAAIVTVVDAANGLGTLEAHNEAAKQVAVADRIVITKTDTDAGAAALPTLVAALDERAPGAAVFDASAPELDLRAVFNDTCIFGAAAKPQVVLDWLAAESHVSVHLEDHRARGVAHAHVHHDHSSHHHDVNRHSEAIRAFCLTIDQPMDAGAYGFAMELLSANQGPDLLRVKGLVAIADYPDKPVVLHMVQHMLHIPVRLDAWPSGDRRTRLVFITRNIAPEPLARFFDSWTRVECAQPASVE